MHDPPLEARNSSAPSGMKFLNRGLRGYAIKKLYSNQWNHAQLFKMEDISCRKFIDNICAKVMIYRIQSNHAVPFQVYYRYSENQVIPLCTKQDYAKL